MKKFFIIAGEASGDLLGSKLIKELKLQNPNSEFIGVGGKLMQEQGLKSIFLMEELSVMGFLEVVPHIKKLLDLIKQTAQAIEKEKPDFVITIDSPDFCFRVVKLLLKAKDLKCKKVHLIAPSVWAYREGRAKKIAKLYDLLLAILPFEPPYFEKYGLKTMFIGNPVVENAPDFSQKKFFKNQFRQKYNISQSSTVLLLTPGSRNGEVNKIFPEFIAAVNLLSEKKSDLKVVIPLIDKTRELVKEMAKALKVEYFLVEKEEKKSAFFAADFALAKSGTNTLEISLYRLPMIIAYKINFLTHFLVKRMVKIKFANLINLISNREIIPEMLQDKCRGDLIFIKMQKLIVDQELAKKQIEDSMFALKLMGLGSVENPSFKAAREILKNS
ncbi:MAG: lipid-A-disaccharide synthase [Proteobacteria bacterium]|nr:lipid-A-disaccharide synthase [Pseudomonadota bacterium]